MASSGIFATQRFVTSEAVEIELPAASLPLRMVSGLIDLLVAAVGVLLLVWLLPAQLFLQDAALGQVFAIVLMVVVMAALPITLETTLHGRTLGKLALGLRTVRDDTGPIGLRHATIRALAGTFELWLTLGAVALIVAATNERGKRLGDFLAGTYVVRDRVRLSIPAAPGMPEGLAGWAQQADIGVLPDTLVVAARQFLTRADSLSPAARTETGNELYLALLDRVAPAPPPAAPADQVLAAVLAERRRRDELRLARDDRLRARLLPSPPPPARRPRHTRRLPQPHRTVVRATPGGPPGHTGVPCRASRQRS
ncbi:MAG: RDD family protein [Ornithinimicrobium sp.]|uniref:RDD family protein n=1 Tax=Ornithinimicrobium sp. TaxID=1977084 RepID=UPI0026E03140|nr:RDD family protein [Ornithinimicrobium sp.]MDO5738822.1 RDD family protein [Ornithinimicrobium sp.]